jgi:hypothetical protein
MSFIIKSKKLIKEGEGLTPEKGQTVKGDQSFFF